MKKFVVILLSGFGCLAVSAQSNTKLDSKFNFGLKGGVNAPFMEMTTYEINGKEIGEPSVNTKVGYLVAVFSRINMKKHYIQLEASLHYTRAELELDLSDFYPSGEGDIDPAPTGTLDVRMHSLEIPLLYGYNFVKRGPYRLSFFAGPKLKYIFSKKNDTEDVPGDRIRFYEDLKPVTANLVVGVGTSISNLLLDVRYEFGLTNISRAVTYSYTDEGGIHIGSARFDRTMNLISFSVGIVF